MSSYSAIPSLPEDQRPRERLMAQGAEALTDAELIALLLSSGQKGTNVVHLASQLLSTCGGLSGLRVTDVVRLAQLPGIGPAKASRVVAALALSARLSASSDLRPVLRRSSDIARAAAPHFEGSRRERVVSLVCGPGHRLRETVLLAEGSVHTASFAVREALSEVLRRDGTAFAVAHNHPSGDPTPTEADTRTTARLTAAAEQVGLRFLDHVVIAGSEWRSVP